jgi:hypothetical protein
VNARGCRGRKDKGEAPQPRAEHKRLGSCATLLSFSALPLSTRATPRFFVQTSPCLSCPLLAVLVSCLLASPSPVPHCASTRVRARIFGALSSIRFAIPAGLTQLLLADDSPWNPRKTLSAERTRSRSRSGASPCCRRRTIVHTRMLSSAFDPSYPEIENCKPPTSNRSLPQHLTSYVPAVRPKASLSQNIAPAPEFGVAAPGLPQPRSHASPLVYVTLSSLSRFVQLSDMLYQRGACGVYRRARHYLGVWLR